METHTPSDSAHAAKLRPPAVIFLHIPKCGGNSFLDFLRASIPPGPEFDVYLGYDYPRRLLDLAALSEQARAELTYIFGHLPWGVHLLLPQPSVYVSLLRHPVDRIVSHYAFVKQNKRHPLRETVLRERMSLIDYVQSGLTGELENGQTRMLCGRAELDSIRGHGPITREHLDEACENLLGDRMRYGLVEMYESSVQLIAHTGEWPAPPPATRRNVTRQRPPLTSISRRAWRAIVDCNQLDMELYTAAVREFERRTKDCGIPFDANRIPSGPASLGRRLLVRFRSPAKQ